VVPSLTTVGAPPAKLGEMAIAMLVELLNNPKGELPHLLVEMALTERESTAPASPRWAATQVG